MRKGILRKLFPGKFREYLPIKKYLTSKTDHDLEAFPETFSNIFLDPREKVPEIPLSHALKSLLEKGSGKILGVTTWIFRPSQL